MPGDADPRPRPVTVLTVDDQPVFRRTARRLLTATPGFEPIGEASSGREALRLVSELRPDLVLLDVRMPDMNGYETARLLRRADPRPMIVLVSIEDVPGGGGPEEANARIRKQDLSVRRLQELWAAHDRG